jgi:hypothetical protein
VAARTRLLDHVGIAVNAQQPCDAALAEHVKKDARPAPDVEHRAEPREDVSERVMRPAPGRVILG